MADLLYVIRSNIAHGEKTPFGPDREKSARDKIVCRATVPVQEEILDELLDHPSQRLVVYGTLRPEAPNASMMEINEAKWLDCTIRGSIAERSGLRFFRANVSGEVHQVRCVLSHELPRQWDRLDAFEGSSYCRWLIPIAVGTDTTIANVYHDATGDGA
jgi:gamma-glutamylcyclotransferase (GGCT)/AIG2-like uncharacterized protein YtfP